MLDSETKRRIDSCRDILVGKVPDPKSQVEQITIALIYKFMDDMDAEAEELGGKRSFFTGEFAQYRWSKLMVPGMGGFDMLSLYSEAIGKMNENPGVPALFRDIFKNAYLPYRDPETLRSFLKEINSFTYDHSERLGDAFEYLLSVLGSQGDAGQFRTPRHIIDFMVEIIDPKKDESILDPACGTAGFLISSYKHILKHNSKDYQAQQDRETYDEQGVPLELLTLDNPLHYRGELLTPDDKKRLATNIRGYDISPDMVRLSLVNMYLHGFASPHIDEYDTLTSDEKWNELADVILANPPFMSPKGGIKPHKRFSITATRSEVLFVDYIAEHLTPNGRAAVIVPEGIIFQSGNAYKQLREMLVKQYLVAVISLPAGVFNPYSGVKTSILVLDKRLAKKTDAILFAKIDNDGFNLGAQRRPIDKNDLPAAVRNIKAWLASLHNGAAFDVESIANLNLVAKEKIGENGDWNLSGDRYRDDNKRHSQFDLLPFDQVCTLEYGAALPKEKRIDGEYPVLGSNGITGYHNEYLVEGPAVIVGRKGSVGEVTYIEENCYPIDTTYYINRTSPDKCDIRYLYHVLKTLDLPSLKGGAGIPGLNRKEVYEKHKIPLPPLEVQKAIVAEIEEYQNRIETLKREIIEQEEKIKTAINRVWGETT
ncbi:N-6 DNA methylase [Nitrosomonas sp. Is24]|uniref:N-6 DNA methylase n=1 Tax=Nitrosomonas sp. Is24 TaxID=3080533 RepID=UPI00294B1ED4|nr:N-6 DNA methylase [Nitrosomonas sp. Is24]MDV6340947.1 N-6 DNA methylase [Nitrosomonas sp. Is24]